MRQNALKYYAYLVATWNLTRENGGLNQSVRMVWDRGWRGSQRPKIELYDIWMLPKRILHWLLLVNISYQFITLNHQNDRFAFWIGNLGLQKRVISKTQILLGFHCASTKETAGLKSYKSIALKIVEDDYDWLFI